MYDFVKIVMRMNRNPNAGRSHVKLIITYLLIIFTFGEKIEMLANVLCVVSDVCTLYEDINDDHIHCLKKLLLLLLLEVPPPQLCCNLHVVVEGSTYTFLFFILFNFISTSHIVYHQQHLREVWKKRGR